MKYSKMNLGQIEALVNKLGGLEEVERILRDELEVRVAAWMPVPPLGGPFAHPDHSTFTLKMKLVANILPKSELDFDIVRFLRNFEETIPGETMLQRAKKLGLPLGDSHARLLEEQPDLIPKQWHFARYRLHFVGTLWESSDRAMKLVWPMLYFEDGKWHYTYYAADDLIGKGPMAEDLVVIQRRRRR